jgi:ABC-2 type transport system permease protein
MKLIKTALAFVKKDLLIMVSYRFEFLLQTVTSIFSIAVLYYIGKLVDEAQFPFLQAYGGSYFGFIVIGMAFSAYFGISINTFFGNIRDGQLTGTLEIILASPTRLFTFLFSSALWSFIYTTIRVSVYIFIGILAFDLEIGSVNIFAALVIFILSIFCFVGVGIIIASLVLVVKRGESAVKIMLGASSVLSGLLFPIDLLPPLLQKIAHFLPLTYTYRGLRLSILEGYSFAQLQGDMAVLFAFAVFFILISVIAFPYAVSSAKVRGSLAQY